MPINYKQLDEFQTKEITQDMAYIYFEMLPKPIINLRASFDDNIEHSKRCIFQALLKGHMMRVMWLLSWLP